MAREEAPHSGSASGRLPNAVSFAETEDKTYELISKKVTKRGISHSGTAGNISIIPVGIFGCS